MVSFSISLSLSLSWPLADDDDAFLFFSYPLLSSCWPVLAALLPLCRMLRPLGPPPEPGRNVIHRDLKPENILVASCQEPASAYAGPGVRTTG